VHNYLFKYLTAAQMTVVNMSSYLPAHFLRLWVLRVMGASIGPGTVIYRGLEVRYPKNLIIGANCSIGDHAILDARGGLIIGDRVNISSQVMIWSRQHDWRALDFATQDRAVVIESYTWLSARSIILPGVVVGEGGVVAAGAVVSRDVDPYSVVAGVPALVVADRPKLLDYLPSSDVRTKLPWW